MPSSRPISYLSQLEIYKRLLFHKRFRLALRCPALRGIARRLGHKFREIVIQNDNTIVIDYNIHISFNQLESCVQVNLRDRHGRDFKVLKIDNGSYDHIVQSFVNYWFSRKGTQIYVFNAYSWKWLKNLSTLKFQPMFDNLRVAGCTDFETVFSFKCKKYFFDEAALHSLSQLVQKMISFQLPIGIECRVSNGTYRRLAHVVEPLSTTWNLEESDFGIRYLDDCGTEYVNRIVPCYRFFVNDNDNMEYIIKPSESSTFDVRIVEKGSAGCVYRSGAPVHDPFGYNEH